MLGAEVLREFLDGLTDYLEIPDHRIEGFLVFEKRGFRQVCRIGGDLASGLQHIFREDPRIPGHRRLLVG
jgi:hypothetical protein